VKLGLTNPQRSQVGIQYGRRGRAGPGYSLGYNRRGLIEGSLPDGTYTVQVTTLAECDGRNVEHHCKGCRLSGPAVTLLPNSSITVSVKEEFQRTDTVLRGLRYLAAFGPVLKRDGAQLSASDVAGRRGIRLASSARCVAYGPEDERWSLKMYILAAYRVRVKHIHRIRIIDYFGGTDLQRSRSWLA